MVSICNKCVNRNDIRKSFVLIHFYVETGFVSVVAFSDSKQELVNILHSYPHFGSSRHVFKILNNSGGYLRDIKDKCLINICKNVAEYLAVGEYAMLKKSFFKASSWFDKAKNSASIGVEIINNY